MGFACIQEPPIHNPDEPAKHWQRKKQPEVLFCFEFTVMVNTTKDNCSFFHSWSNAQIQT